LEGKKALEAILRTIPASSRPSGSRASPTSEKPLKTGEYYAFFGTVKRFGRYLSMAHPEVEQLSTADIASQEEQKQRFAGIIPIYPGNQFFKKTYITSGLLRKWILTALNAYPSPNSSRTDLLKFSGTPNEVPLYTTSMHPKPLPSTGKRWNDSNSRSCSCSN
jgi:ATP-dependent DNA helicase RecG